MKTKSIVHHLAQLPFVSFILAVVLTLVVAGCGTDNTIHYSQNPVIPPKDTRDATLREADTVKVTFPGTANLEATTQVIRRDGKITLPIIGEVVAAGKTPTQLEKELRDTYSTQLVSSQEITVQVQAASFPVFISGAVNRPGKLTLDHPITVLEAVMESGGFDLNRAKLNKIKVIRGQDKPGQTKTYTINLKGFLDGSAIDVFYLQPEDIVYVPSKIQWF